jgi:hypothetical protein
MLNKIAAHSILQHDSDLKLFLESDAFNVDIKNKERKDPGLGESKGMLSSIGISVGSSGKFIEHDDVSTPIFYYAELLFDTCHSGFMIAECTSTPLRTSSRRCSKRLTW